MVSHWTSVCLSVCLSFVSLYFVFRYLEKNISGFSPNLVCALILWRSGMGLLVGKFHQILTELSARDMPIILFPDDNLSKYQGILTNLVHALIFRRSDLGLLMGKFRQFLMELSACDMIMAGYYSFTLLFMLLFCYNFISWFASFDSNPRYHINLKLWDR